MRTCLASSHDYDDFADLVAPFRLHAVDVYPACHHLIILRANIPGQLRIGVAVVSRMFESPDVITADGVYLDYAARWEIQEVDAPLMIDETGSTRVLLRAVRNPFLTAPKKSH